MIIIVMRLLFFVLLEKICNCNCTGFGWYIILVTLVCGIIIGMIFLYGIMSLRQRFKSKKDESKPAHNYDTPEKNSYQALRMNTRKRINNETKIEDEANYQELDKVREIANSYQSLNRV